jgi:hypothetical protein
MVVTEQTVVVKPKRVRKAETVAGGDMNDILMESKRQHLQLVMLSKTAATVAPYVLPLVGLGKDGKT